MLLGPCGRHRVDASGESAVCSAKAREKGQDRRRRMFPGCPQQLPRPAAHFTPQAATGHGLGSPSSPPAPTLLLLRLGQKAKASGGSGARLQAVARGCSSGMAMLQHLPRLYGRGRMGESGEEAPCSRTGSPVDWC